MRRNKERKGECITVYVRENERVIKGKLYIRNT